MKEAVPALIPVTRPVDAPIDATVGELDVQTGVADDVSPLAMPFTYFSFTAEIVVVPPTGIEYTPGVADFILHVTVSGTADTVSEGVTAVLYPSSQEESVAVKVQVPITRPVTTPEL